MPQQFSDHRQAFADDKAAAGEGMPKVVEPHIVKSGRFSNAPPGMLKICEAASGLLSCNDELVALEFRDRLKPVNRRRAEMNGLCTRFGVGQA